jgi:uncharacterized repeat protein (TIGR03803 family)
MDKQGNLYGTTELCGSSGDGIVWKVSKEGKETVLHNFTGADGEEAFAGVIMDAEGNLYGTTGYGGSSGQGVVYKLSKTGKETVLHSFTGGADGGRPLGGVIMDAKGSLYGTAANGGSSIGSPGTVWKLTP